MDSQKEVKEIDKLPLTQSQANKSTERFLQFTVRELQSLLSRLFKEAGIDTSVLDAQLILANVLDKERIDIQLLGHATKVFESHAREIFRLCARRLQYEPMAYILGKKEFYGADFLVSKDCLIPRPDTEVVVEKCLDLLPKSGPSLVYDLCTGGGIIAISLLRERKALSVEASDISVGALSLAEINAELHGVSSRLVLHHGDLFSPFLPKELADLIVANPPYIASSAINNLHASVRNYEPRLALDAGDDHGVAFHHRIIGAAHRYLKKGGYLVLEIGFDQKANVSEMLGEAWHLIEFFQDLAQNTRGIVLKKR